MTTTGRNRGASGRVATPVSARQASTATQHRDLRTGTPVWLLARRAPRVPAPPLDRALQADCVVIGAGVTGALVTDALLAAGRRVVVLDRRGPLKGATPASTALLQFELDTPLRDLARTYGRDRAARVWWRSATAVSRIRDRIADLDLRCGFAERSVAYLPGNLLDVAGLREEAALRARLGLRSRFVDRTELEALTGLDRPGAIWSQGAGELDPVAFVGGLWRSCLARGAALHTPVDVRDVDPGREMVRIETDTGHPVHARHVVFASGFELPKQARPRGYKVISTWALATPPQRRAAPWRSRCLIWQAADPYLYARTTPEGRIVAGGEDEEFADEDARDAKIPRKTAAVLRKLAALLPGIDARADAAWAGCFGASPNGMPAIGRIPGMNRCHAVLGFGGNGITFSAIAAQIIARDVVGVADPDADLFAIRS